MKFGHVCKSKCSRVHLFIMAFPVVNCGFEQALKRSVSSEDVGRGLRAEDLWAEETLKDVEPLLAVIKKEQVAWPTTISSSSKEVNLCTDSEPPSQQHREDSISDGEIADLAKDQANHGEHMYFTEGEIAPGHLPSTRTLMDALQALQSVAVEKERAKGEILNKVDQGISEDQISEFFETFCHSKAVGDYEKVRDGKMETASLDAITDDAKDAELAFWTKLKKWIQIQGTSMCGERSRYTVEESH